MIRLILGLGAIIYVVVEAIRTPQRDD